MNSYFPPEALQEYTEAAQYYSAISPSLASAFVSQVENGINQILLYPQAWQPIESDVRRCLIKRSQQEASLINIKNSVFTCLGPLSVILPQVVATFDDKEPPQYPAEN